MVLLGCARLSNLRLNRYSTVLSHRFALTFIFISYLYTSMSTPDDIFRIADEAAFEAAALEVFRRQAAECAPYREYLSLIGVRPGEVRTADAIPYLPIGLFKTHEVYCGGTEPGSGLHLVGHHRHDPRRATRCARCRSTNKRSALRSRRSTANRHGGASTHCCPTTCGAKARRWSTWPTGFCPTAARAAFYLDDHEALLGAMRRDPKPKILLGVSYALWDLAERYAPKLDDTIVMETGGMKGYREGDPQSGIPQNLLCDLHSSRQDTLRIRHGGTHVAGLLAGREHLPLPGLDAGRGTRRNDPFDRLPAGSRGGLDIADLASWWSCAFIQTQDVGRVAADGAFEVEGRIDHSDIRGCNLLVQ